MEVAYNNPDRAIEYLINVHKHINKNNNYHYTVLPHLPQ